MRINSISKGRSSAFLLHAGWILLAVFGQGALAVNNLSALVADRGAVERVYYEHRLGDKPPFEEVLPAAMLENMVWQDVHKETVLKRVYGVEITPVLLEAEVRRIDSTTRAPEMLAEIKAALGNDPARFGAVFAKPILVERLLRVKFDNDDALHAPQRRRSETMRNELLAAHDPGRDYEKLLALLNHSYSNTVTETTWQLAARPAETNAPSADELEIKKHFGPEAKILSAPHAEGEETKFYFEDLPDELQNVLRVQLRRTGDVSAVIETPRVFLLYVVKEKTEEVLSVAVLALPKRSYEQWLENESEDKP